MLHIN